MLTTPILNIPTSFDATDIYNFIFNVIGGSQVVKNNLVITRTSDNTIIYNQTEETFEFKHELPASTLSNQVQYKAIIRTGDIYGNWSEWSSPILFTCYKPADVSITNLTGGIANNQNYTFTGSYQDYGDALASYIFILYDENSIQLEVSPISYSSTIEAQFTLENQTNYEIELKAYSQSGVEISSGKIPFLATYLAPTMGAEIQIKNLPNQGAIELELIAVDYEAEGESYTFESSEWINLTANGAVVRFREGLNNIVNNYSIKLHLKNITEDTPFLQIISGYGNIVIKYSENRFHAWQYAMGLTGHFVSSEDITVSTTDMVCLEIKVIGGLIDVFAEIYT